LLSRLSVRAELPPICEPPEGPTTAERMANTDRAAGVTQTPAVPTHVGGKG